MNYDFHTVKVILLSVQVWVLTNTYNQLATITTIKIYDSFSPPKSSFTSFCSQSLPHPQMLVTTDLFLVPFFFKLNNSLMNLWHLFTNGWQNPVSYKIWCVKYQNHLKSIWWCCKRRNHPFRFTDRDLTEVSKTEFINFSLKWAFHLIIGLNETSMKFNIHSTNGLVHFFLKMT